LWAITSAPTPSATLLQFDDNSWWNGAARGEKWSACHQ